MRFGTILFPLHPVGQSPTVALEKDLELLEWMDRWNYAEAWVGEHHSGGFELIGAPEVFVAIAAERTKHLRLGTGVTSLPYHHPFTVVERMILLDHLTRGRVMFGVGPGQLVSDAKMLGIDTTQQRRMMAESLDAIVELLKGDPVEHQDRLVHPGRGAHPPAALHPAAHGDGGRRQRVPGRAAGRRPARAGPALDRRLAPGRFRQAPRPLGDHGGDGGGQRHHASTVPTGG